MKLDEASNRFTIACAARSERLGEVDTAFTALHQAEASLEPLNQLVAEALENVTAAKCRLREAGDHAQIALANSDPVASGVAALEAFDKALKQLVELNAEVSQARTAADTIRASLVPLRDAVHVAKQRLHTSETALREAADKLRGVIGGTVAGACA